MCVCVSNIVSNVVFPIPLYLFFVTLLDAACRQRREPVGLALCEKTVDSNGAASETREICFSFPCDVLSSNSGRSMGQSSYMQKPSLVVLHVLN